MSPLMNEIQTGLDTLSVVLGAGNSSWLSEDLKDVEIDDII